ncbi:polyprenyl synthetase family protein [Gracilibacillus sp. YIM 98692]|uniref:polyprenyl synthetase family protein n=1 Tax=Gracilibacillus sp. YIM 98692 TaxID=2663532 RepID=UPI0013D6B6D5|nr:farnesyl diphosphate synthase [Gracilibacillus sp. YIM 98692]
MNDWLKSYIKEEQTLVNDCIHSYLSDLHIPKRLKESVLYSVDAGGKRLRPILMKLTCEGFHGNAEKIYPAAIALEMIHTYSLIHDDLPAMDDDDYRRGRLTNHKQFDEATAILAGDALLTNSFHVISSNPFYTAEEKVHLVQKLSKASGMEGMVAGQFLDIESETKNISISEMEHIHHLKTGRLLSYAVEIGSYLAGESEEVIEKIKEFGDCIGLIFQIQDDILDVIGDETIMGKPAGSDVTNDKNTYTSLLGLEGAISRKNYYVQKAKQYLHEVGLIGSKLECLTDYLSDRDL